MEVGRWGFKQRMNNLKKQIKKEQKRATPSRAFKGALWSKLSRAHDAMYPKQTHSVLFRFAIVGVAAIVLFVSTGAGVYAYESPQVVEGHPLHFVKDRIEGVEKTFATGPESRARFHAKMMGRRILEAEAHRENPEVINRLAPRIADEFGMTLEELHGEVGTDVAARNRILRDVQLHNKRYGIVLERLQEHRNTSTRPIPPPELRPLIRELQGQFEAGAISDLERREIFESEFEAWLEKREPEVIRGETTAEGDIELRGTVE